MSSLRPVASVLFFVFAGFAQSDRGTITGTVLDPAGAVIADAPLQAKNVETNAVYEAATSNTGNYTIAQLPAGTYEVTATVPGFKKYIRPGLVVQVAATLRVDVTLEVGSASESVTISEEAPLLDTESGDLGHNVATASLDTLPVLGIGTSQAGSSGIRNPNSVLFMIPGAYYQPNQDIRVNGAPNNTQGIRIEGMDSTNSNSPGITAATQPSVDSIQEITVQTSNFAAEYGQVGGGVFNVTMKSGSNQYHGTGYDYFVNEVLNAGDPFTDAPAGTGNPRPRQRRNDYGFTLGGPVRIPKIYNGHDKTFFFFNWEEFRESQIVSTQFETVPTDAYRQGNFATALTGKTIGTDPLGRPIGEGEIYDPQTTRTVNGQSIRDPFPGNIIPLSRFDPVATKIQNLFPQPDGPFANALVNNYLPVFPTARVTTVPSVKGDQIIGPKGKLSFYWTRVRTSSSPPGPPNGGNTGLPDPIVTATATFIRTSMERLNFDYTLTPTLLLHFGAGYQQTNQDLPSTTSTGAIPNYNVETQLGLQGGIVNTAFPPMSGILATNGTGGAVSIGGNTNVQNITERPAFNTNLTWVRSNHTYKFGSEIRFDGYPAISSTGTSGNYTFSTAQTSLPYLNGTTLQGTTPGFGYGSFMLGLVQQVSISNPVEPRLGKKQFGTYAQDSWKVTRKFTLDYGVRYDYSTYLQEEHGRDPFFSPTTPNPAVGNIPGAVIFDRYGPGHCDCDVAKNYPFGAAPRLGAAYQITSKTVFRAGFGIVYSGTENNNMASSGLAGSTNTVSAPSFGAAVTTLATGIPASFDPPPWPNLNPGQFNVTSTPVALTAPWIDPNAGRPARQYQWSISIQQQISPNFVVEASYVGNRGIWWLAPGLMNLNAINFNSLSAVGLNISSASTQQLLTSSLSSSIAASMGFNHAPYPGFPLNQSVAQSLRPYPQFTTLNAYWDPLGDTWYNAMQLKATKRLSHGLSAVSTFTWQKSLTLGSEADPTPGTSGNAVFNDVFNRQNNKYTSLYDQPFQFNVSLNYTTPKLNTNKILSWVARDWLYGAYLAYRSGLPIEAPLANNNLSSMVFQPTFANRVPGVPLYTVNLNCHCYDPNTTFVLNPAAWTNPPAGQFGTSAAYYSDYRYQRRPVENMNLGRTWRIRERASFNMRMEFTNVFNRSFFNNPTATNAQAIQTRLPNGNTSSGFGYVNTTTAMSGLGIVTPVSIAPRNGVLVARITF